ncbi:hypothetical protein CPB86DRAFT_719689 [Serendipita vermifera]|nr:hypothetical protein CPB86DRAFT_719689 [Serendipita vermifera]
MNPAGTPPVAYGASPQYPGTDAPPPGQYPQQWSGAPGTTPNYPPQMPPGQYTPGQQFAPGQPQFTPGQQPQYAPGQPQFTPGQPQFVPQQQPGAPLTATPITALNRGSAPVDCPVCGQRAVTSTRKVIGSNNHLWAAITCFCCCLGCIPYLLDDLKDVEHSCSNCGTHLATYYKSGGTEAMVHR